MLTLPIKKKWFDMILSGKKKEEYREKKPYYTSRFYNLVNVWRDDETTVVPILFRNGYSNNSPTIKCMVTIGEQHGGNTNWGAEPNKEYYVLKILSVEEVK